MVERDAQLHEGPVQEFVRSMEQRRLTNNAWHSIFSLMRDGRELATTLLRSARSPDRYPLEQVISPYLQFVQPEAVCEHTGLRLTDIWRYFRLTWVTAYRPLPGRSVLVLVRDAAGPNHPVIGIAALGSSVVQQESRDQWIGWTPREFMKQIDAMPKRVVSRWISRSLNRQLEGIHVADLINDGILGRRSIERPTPKVIVRLRTDASRARVQHRRHPQAAAHKAQQSGLSGWKHAARTKLFRSKRCEALARLLAIRSALDEYRSPNGKLNMKAVLASATARAALSQLVRLVKAEHVGINMMDITVCGAVAPYNCLLGGKLVSVLLASHEIVDYYRRRYRKHASVIASSMKGAAVLRPPRLVLLGTTSLYGVGSSQYNRIRVPCAEISGGRVGDTLEYRRLGLSKGFGSFHFSKTTIQLIDTLLARGADGRRVNSLFGEGVNPLLRKIREALELLGFPSDRILNHGNPRVVYGVALARNFSDVLTGLRDKPDYLLPGGDPGSSTKELAAYWRRRWLFRRIARPEVLDTLRQHTLVYPVKHGARVRGIDAEDTSGLCTDHSSPDDFPVAASEG
jgi:hypothetical protein